jgi:hypothetical protein
MSIPLDRLYHFINNIANEIYGDNTLIIRFDPPGSKKLEDLTFLLDMPYVDEAIGLQVYCNDQEPLQYDFYSDIRDKAELTPFQRLRISVTNVTIDRFPNIRTHPSINDLALLLHSEKRSTNLKQYQDNTFIPVYYWSHAIIALDWFRFAKHSIQQKKVNKIFLIYNRAWSGTREYRLKFAELLIRLGLATHCQTGVNPIEPELGIHYEIHEFKNPAWRPTTVLENYFPINAAHSHYSADFDIEDYETTDIEVVLETLFDDSRLHLTEKSLRPIACGQPFILAGTHGSLDYLQGYGFKTFGNIWDESYDTIEDPQERLHAIMDLMAQITNWQPLTREKKLAEALAIAEYNQQHFFSKEFFDQVVNELNDNFKSAFEVFNAENTCQQWIDRWQTLLANQEILNFFKNNDAISNTINMSLEEIENIIQIAEQRTNLSQ